MPEGREKHRGKKGAIGPGEWKTAKVYSTGLEGKEGQSGH